LGYTTGLTATSGTVGFLTTGLLTTYYWFWAIFCAFFV